MANGAVELLLHLWNEMWIDVFMHGALMPSKIVLADGNVFAVIASKLGRSGVRLLVVHQHCLVEIGLATKRTKEALAF